MTRFDAPDAAHRFAEARRAPLSADIDPAALSDLASRQSLRLSRFSSKAGRSLPDASEPARLWLSGDRIVGLDGRISPNGVLDAWTPIGPGNIGGRTRVVRFSPH